MYKYDVSVIVPIYNAQEYIAECIQSILDQEFEGDRIQIVLVNDGSNDDSGDICNMYKEKYENILYLEQKNAGVSSARNLGMKNAEGKYIMFLDSDDKITNNAIKDLYEFFEEHYDEIDLVSYPLIYIEDGERKVHYRYSLYDKGTNVYDLEDYIYLGQSNMNIIIKNKGDKNSIFSLNLHFSEDEEFNTRILMEKKKIGFCSEAEYLYNKHNSNVTKTQSNPFFHFEDLMKYHEGLIEKYNSDTGVPRYIQAIILNDIRWRVSTDQLLPYHYEKEALKKAEERIKKLVESIDIDVILNMPRMDIYHKFFVFNMKGIEVDSYYGNKSFSLMNDEKILYCSKNVEIVVNRFVYNNNSISVLGYLKSPLFSYEEPKLILVTEREEIREETIIKTFNSNCNKYKSKMDTAKFYAFDVDIPIENIDTFYFEVIANDNIIQTQYLFTKFSPFNKRVSGNYLFKENYRILFQASKFYIEKLEREELVQYKREILKRVWSLRKKVFIFRMLVKRNRNKKIWLYCDRDGVFDNAYYQFKHDINKQDGIIRYYVIDDKFRKVKNKFVRREYKYIIKYGSLKHKVLFLSSDKILSSFQYSDYYRPFKDGIQWYKDILKYKLIYLQHGVLHCHAPWIYSNERNEIDKIVISSNYEKENFMKNYNYKEENLIPSGMPRFDFVNLNKKPDKKIVYAPTWRNRLIGDLVGTRRELKETEFLTSKYFTKINNLLKSEKLKELLKKNGYVFELKLHPIFRDYIDLFEESNEFIKVNADAVQLDEYKLFITDYSSFVFDYVYLERPVIYFLPDDDEFRAGLHLYRELDMPLEDAFGDIKIDEKDLIDKIEYYMNNDFAIEEKYKKRIEGFFITKENHREKLYNMLKEQ